MARGRQHFPQLKVQERSYGIYDAYDGKRVPQVREFTDHIPAEIGIEFGFVLRITGGAVPSCNIALITRNSATNAARWPQPLPVTSSSKPTITLIFRRHRGSHGKINAVSGPYQSAFKAHG